MSHVASSSVVRQLGALFEGGSMAGLSDRELLERYADAGRDPDGESAFAAIVARHGPMVLGICRQLLGDAAQADDAFQAVFLVLARKARSLRDPDRLGNWLYGVAVRTSRCARQRDARRRRREEDRAMIGHDDGPCGPPADRPAIDREQAEALHAEIERLPARSRLPVVLCYFEGLSIEQAARRLRCPAGTLHSRLARAREKLRVGLARRGVVLSGAAVAAALAPRSASASVSPLLCASTARAAIAFAAPHAAAVGAPAAPASAIAREVLQAMLIHKLKLVTMTVIVLAATATGAGYLARSLAMKAGPSPKPTASAPRPAADDKPEPAGRMTVAGRVLDPDGRPVRGAVVDLVARPRTPWVAAREEIERPEWLGRADSGPDGRFRIDAPRPAWLRDSEVGAIAAAPGFGLGWAKLDPDAESPRAEIRLAPEEALRARLVEIGGGPARGAVAHVMALWRPDAPDGDNGGGVYLGDGLPPRGLRAWPGAIKADDRGRIVLKGIGRGVRVRLQVRDVPYARQDLMIDPAKSAGGREPTIVLQPARVIEGRVLAADTGRPIPLAIVSAETMLDNDISRGYFTAKFRADDRGHFAINPIAGESHTLGAIPAGGEPYLIAQQEFRWTGGAMKATHDIKLPRGVLIRGKVTEAGTDRPLAAASVQYIPIGGPAGVLSGWQAMVASGDDGSFAIAVPPGKGHLLVHGPTGDYVPREIGFNRLYQDRPGGQRYRAHAIVPYEVGPGETAHQVDATLRRGVTIRGRVEGPDGQAVARAAIVTALRFEAYNPFWRGDYQVPVRDGRFELHGLAPDATARVHVLDADHEWGATLELSGKQAGKEVAIRLQPCGKARARIVGTDRRPVAGYHPTFELIATTGPSRFAKNLAELAADEDFVANVDRKHYSNGPAADAEGHVTLVALIPGARYRIGGSSPGDGPAAAIPNVREFTVKPGETLDLGDILARP